MYHYNKSRARQGSSQEGQNLFGPQFSLQASATVVAERPITKQYPRDVHPTSASTVDPSTSLLKKYGQPTELQIAAKSQQASRFQSDKPGTQPQRNAPNVRKQTVVPAAAYAHDLTNNDHNNLDDRYKIVQNSGNNRKNPSMHLPGDRVIFAESPSAPGVPIVYRTPEERAANPDRLNLDRRRLAVCPILEGEEQLRLLNYQHNVITQIQHLSSLKRLIFLDLYDNHIEEISGLTALRSLRVLMLGKNRIKKIENLDALIKLDVLDLHGNQITDVENLVHLSELRVLNLAGNQIVHVENLGGLDALAELNLRRNRIVTVSEIENLPSLQRLYLSFNEICSFEDISCLAESQSLSEVALDGNPFSGDPHYKTIMLRHLGLLKQLDLKRVTEEERRVAALMYKKEEDKRRNSNKEALVKDSDRVMILYSPGGSPADIQSLSSPSEPRSKFGFTAPSTPVLLEKRRLAINNAKRQWEVMQGSLMHRTNRLVKMPELYATHVGSYSHSDLPALGRDNPSQTPDSMREDSDSVMSPVRPSSARAFIQVEGGRNKFWDMKQNCFMTTGLRNDRSRPTSAHSIQNGGTSSDINRERKKERPTTANRLSSRSSSKSSVNRNASPEKETITYNTDPSLGTCHLAELEGDTLSLYGVGSLEALDRNWGIQAAGNITTIAFQFMDFTELVKHLGKIRARFPSVQTLIFQATNIESFHQLNALSSVRRLDNLVIDPEGNPVTQLSLWKLYTVFRLAHFSLKKINNVEVTSADILNAEKFFGPLSHITTSQLSQSRLLTLLGENRKKQLLSLSEEKSRKSPDGKLAEHKSAIESIGRAGLVYPPLEEQVKKGEEQKSKLDFAQKFVRQISREAVVVDRKLTTLYQVWPQIMVSLIQSAVMDMADRKTYMKKCMEDLEKG